MGMYDCRCIITGVGLKGAKAVLVLLADTAGAHRPMALGITGDYNRAGAIDAVEEDRNTQLVLQHFLDRLADGRLVADAEHLQRDRCYPITDINALLTCVERSMRDHPDCFLLEGKKLAFALISKECWDAIAGAHGDPNRVADILNGPIYAGHQPEVAEHARQLAAVDALLEKHALHWQPEEEPWQHYKREMQTFLTEAREKFKAEPGVLQGLDRYEEEVSEFLE